MKTKILTLSQVLKLDIDELVKYANNLLRGTKYKCSYDRFINYEIAIKIYEEINDWLSQKFKPKLIAELFDGWAKVYDFWQSDSGDCFHELHPWKFEYYNSSRRVTREFGTPITIGDFVNDCDRCGIELYLKELPNAPTI